VNILNFSKKWEIFLQKWDFFLKAKGFRFLCEAPDPWYRCSKRK